MSSYPEEIYEYEDPRPLARWLNRILYLCVIEMALELALTIIPQYLLAYRMNNADGYFRYLKPDCPDSRHGRALAQQPESRP